MAAIGSVNAVSLRLIDVMLVAAEYDGIQLHSNVTACDVCMYLATGYQHNPRGTVKNITTEAYGDHDQGVAKVVTRYVNGKYDNTTEALDTYNKLHRVLNFNLANCDGVTDDEVISWYFLSTVAGTSNQDFDRGRRDVVNSYCYSPGQSSLSSQGKLDAIMSSYYGASRSTSCGSA